MVEGSKARRDVENMKVREVPKKSPGDSTGESPSLWARADDHVRLSGKEWAYEAGNGRWIMLSVPIHGDGKGTAGACGDTQTGLRGSPGPKAHRKRDDKSPVLCRLMSRLIAAVVINDDDGKICHVAALLYHVPNSFAFVVGRNDDALRFQMAGRLLPSGKTFGAGSCR